MSVQVKANQSEELKELSAKAKFLAKAIVICDQPLPTFSRVEQVLDKMGIVKPPKKAFYKLSKSLREQGINKNSMITSRASEVIKVDVLNPGEVTEQDVIEAIEYLTGKKVLPPNEVKANQIENIIEKLSKKD